MTTQEREDRALDALIVGAVRFPEEMLKGDYMTQQKPDTIESLRATIKVLEELYDEACEERDKLTLMILELAHLAKKMSHRCTDAYCKECDGVCKTSSQ